MCFRLFLLLLLHAGSQVIAQESLAKFPPELDHFFGLHFSLLLGNAPLYVLDGDITSETTVISVGAGFYYQADISNKLFVRTGLKGYSVASDFNLSPRSQDQENIIARSKFLSIPLVLGTSMVADRFKVEFGTGAEFGRLYSQKEQIISTSRFIVLEEENVNLNQVSIQRNNLQIIAMLGLSTQLSGNLHTYLSLQGNLGLSDMDSSFKKQPVSRLEMQAGIRYKLGTTKPISWTD